MGKKIFKSLEEYNKKYRFRRHKLLKFTKKEVENFDIKNHTTNKSLLKGKKWNLIGDTYYQIPRTFSLTWFVNTNKAIQVLIVASSLGIIAGGTTGIVFAVKTFNKPTPSPNKYTITFNTRGGSEIKPVEVIEGNTLTIPDDPIKEYSKIKYWTKNNETDPYDFSSPVNESFTLNAYYKASENKVKVKGLNFGNEKDSFDSIDEMYKAGSSALEKVFGDDLTKETFTTSDNFKSLFTDIEEDDTSIKANLTFELYSKDNEQIKIPALIDGKNTNFLYTLGKKHNYCGTDTTSNKDMFINTITFKSGTDDNAKIQYEQRVRDYPRYGNKLFAMFGDDSKKHNNTYTFSNIDFDNFELDQEYNSEKATDILFVQDAGVLNNAQPNVNYESCSFNMRLTLGHCKNYKINNCYFYQDESKETTEHKYINTLSAVYLSSTLSNISDDSSFTFTNNYIDNYGRGFHIEDSHLANIDITNNTFANINKRANTNGNCAINMSKTKLNGSINFENNLFEKCNCNTLKVHSNISKDPACYPIININNNEFNSCKYLGWSKATKSEYTLNSSGNKLIDTDDTKCEISDDGTTSSEEKDLIKLN